MTTPQCEIPYDYTPPERAPPLLAGMLGVTHERHYDMMRLVRDLPHDALLWRPGSRMSSLAGLVRHIMDDDVRCARRAAGETVADVGNGAFMDATDDAPTLVACIVEGDALVKRLLEPLTPAHLAERRGSQADSPVAGRIIADMVDHNAMHWGQMQLTRHLWEHAHPDFRGAYEHWW